MDPKLKELHEKRKAVSDKIAVIVANSELTDEQLAEVETLEADYASLGTEIEKAEKAAAIRARQTARATESANAVTAANRKTSHNSGEPHITTKLASENDPMRGFKTPRDFVSAVMSAGMGDRVDEKLLPLRQAAAGSDEHSGSDNNYGGFLVPEGMSPDFLQVDPEDDPMINSVRRVPMDNKSVKFNYRVDKDHSSSVSGGLQVTRKAETVAGTLSRMQTGQFDLTAHSLFGFAAATEEILVDSPRSFAALIAAGFSQEFTSKIIDERLNGTGVGEFQGILGSPALISVAAETGQDAATIEYNNIVKMVARCWGYGNAIWIANHTTLPQLATLSAPAGTGGNAMIWQPSAREGSPSTLMGRPIVFTEYCKALGTVGDIVLFNGNEYIEGIYQPLQSAESMHVRFMEHERLFKFWMRNAGSPWWDSPLTPKNGDTLSPFVALATR